MTLGAAFPLNKTERAKMLYNNEVFEAARKSVKWAGDSHTSPEGERNGGPLLKFLESGERL